MRTCITTFLIFILISLTSNAQWRVMNPHPTPNTTYIGSAPSDNSFITVSGQGEAIITHDGGQNWDIVQIGGNGIYRSCYFLNDNLGWAVGSFVERLHKTTDGGLTWTWQSNAPDKQNTMCFLLTKIQDGQLVMPASSLKQPTVEITGFHNLILQ